MTLDTTDSGYPVLRAALETAMGAMLVIDPNGTIVAVNRHTEELFGYAPGTLLGEPLSTLLPEPLRHSPVSSFRELAATPRVRSHDLRYRLPGVLRDGTRFAAEVCLRPLADWQGGVAFVSIRDLSGLRNIQRDMTVVQIGRLLLEMRDYREAVAQVPTMANAIMHVDAVAVFSTEWGHHDLRVRAMDGLAPEQGELLATAFSANGIWQRFCVSGELSAITTDGVRRPEFAIVAKALDRLHFRDLALVPIFGLHEPMGLLVALSCTPGRFGHGSVSFLQSIANLLASAVQRGRAQVQLAHSQRLDAIGQLTGGIAHDFNNLLTIVSGNLQLLEMDLGERDGAAIEAIDAAQHAVERGAELTRKLLAFARRQPLRPAVTAVRPLLDGLGRMLTRTLGETIQLQIDCAADIPDVYADPTALETALINLALNARDAMPRGGRVTLTARHYVAYAAALGTELTPGQYVRFAIRDTGTGMSPEILEHVLEPFVTTKEPGKGSGLGLPMVYGFTEQSGGSLRIRSRLGFGTTVVLYLPAASQSEHATTPQPEPLPATGLQRVLVVEDEPEVRNVALTFLQSLGYTASAVGSARDALERLKREPAIDLLFSDVVLGGDMDGVALAEAAQRMRPGLPVLLTSGYPRSDGIGAETGNAFELLQKPYRREGLAAAIARTWQHR